MSLIKKSIVPFFFCLLVIMPVMLVLLDNKPPVERRSGKIVRSDDHGRALEGSPRAGETVQVVWDATIRRSCPGLVKRTIIDSHGTTWRVDDGLAAYPTSGDRIIRMFKLPLAMAPGKAVYRVEVDYFCNPLHYWFPIRTMGPDVPFEVLEK